MVDERTVVNHIGCISNKLKSLPPLCPVSCSHSILTVSIKSIFLKYDHDKIFSVRLQWWGETEPSIFQYSTSYSVNLKTLKPYLDLCQIVEFTVTNAKIKEDVGGAFLYDPRIIFINPIIDLSIVDHQGDAIGSMKVEFMITLRKDPMLYNMPVEKEDNLFINITNSQNLASIEPQFKVRSAYKSSSYNMGRPIPTLIEKFLMGKTMTHEDEKKALCLLSEWSPNHSLVVELTKL